MQNEILGGFTQFQRQSHCFLWFKFLVIYPPSHSKRSWKGVFSRLENMTLRNGAYCFTFLCAFLVILSLDSWLPTNLHSLQYIFASLRQNHQYLEHHPIFTQASHISCEVFVKWSLIRNYEFQIKLSKNLSSEGSFKHITRTNFIFFN